MKFSAHRQYYDVTTNPKRRTAAILKIVISQYLSEKLNDFAEIWHVTNLKQNQNPVIKQQK